MMYFVILLGLLGGIAHGLTDLREIRNGTLKNGIPRSKNLVSYLFTDY